MPEQILPTTVVGSYPAVGSGGLGGALLDPLKPARKTAVSDQITAGIDIISDGQVGRDMIALIADFLPGVKGQDVTGQIHPAGKPITLPGVKYALSRHPAVKGILTGPTTLAHGLALKTPVYRDRNELIPDLARALAQEARYLADAGGVTILQLDEPILSTGAADLSVAREAVSIITKNVNVPSCMHVCGNIRGCIDEILQFPVDILDFEFANNPDNLDVLSRSDLKGKKIGFGCVDSADREVESVTEIKDRITKGIDIFGAETMLLDPDCGLRMHSREGAYNKLEHLVLAAHQCRKEL
ncbi:methionine synthase [Methanogenium cariaci]|uniref:methionine synthase n=1 Tax=Methanogenium cariaci TaxID=2197 RepID=UPI0009F85B09|nr:methionine synthase [Methanogenium cariaci]